MPKRVNPSSGPEGTELPVSLRALMQQLGQAAGAQGQRGRFFDALRAICLTVDPSLLWQSDRADLAGFLSAMGAVESRVQGGALDDDSCLDALMGVLAVHGYLAPAARPVLTDRLARTLASYRAEFWQEDEAAAADTVETANMAEAAEVVDWNALGARLMRPPGEHVGLADIEDDTGWEVFPTPSPQGPTLH